MSMNIEIKVVAKAIIIKTGEEFENVVDFNVIQTPTDVTYKIMESENKMEEYENYVTSVSKDEEVPVFAEDDVFQEEEPVGYKTVNEGEEHLVELHNEVKYYTNKGYDIIFDVI